MSIDTKETLKDFSQNYDKVKDEFADMISFFRQYPDYFLDYIRAENALFELTPFQRVYLRAFFRYKKVGIIASRGVSKTYVNILAHYIKCVLYPNLHIGVIMPTKIQSAKISEEKIKEIWRDYPLLKNEIKKYKVTRDYVQFEFKGGSTLDTVASGESSRGLRAQGLSFEEIVDERMDRTTINEVLLPLLAQGRRTPHGVDTKNEQQKTQAWVTTAGAKQSFSYEKFQGLYDEMIDGKSTIVLGTSYEMGTKFGTLDINDIVDKLNDPSYSPLSFDREYRSLFTGSSERSLVSMDDINEIRVLENPEYKATAKDKKDQSIKYVLSYDVSRSEGNKNAQSALVVLKLHDRGDGTYRKQLVNIFTGEGTHFREQARFLKKKVNDYGASILIIDHNGIGKGLADELVMEIDENPPYSVVNDDRYDRYKTPESVPLLYLFNSTTKENRNSDVVNHFMTTIANRGVQLLKSEGSARGFIDNIRGSEDEVKKLVPFVQTDRLIDEVMNLEYVQTGVNTTVKAVSRKIEKDRYSAFAYALYYVYIEEQNNKKRKNRVKNNAQSFINIKPPRYRAGV